MSGSNIFEAGAAEIPELFTDYIEAPAHPGSCVVLALSASPVPETARDAIRKSLAALGFGEAACTYATLAPLDQQAEGGDIVLDAQSLFLLVEGLDPLRLIAADGRACDLLAAAYRTSLPRNAAARVFGRPAALFDNLDELLQTPQGKQRAWAIFKTFS